MSNIQRAVKLFSVRKCLTALYASNPGTSVISSFSFFSIYGMKKITNRAQSIATIEPNVIVISAFIWFMHLSIL